MLLDGDSALQEQWTGRSGPGGPRAARTPPRPARHDGAWLDGDAAAAIACDAAMAPIVTGDVNVTPWRTWSGSASNWTAPPGRRRPAAARHHRGPGRRWNKR